MAKAAQTVAPVPNQALTVETPDYLKALAQNGAVHENDGFDSTDVVVPRIKLLQAVSEEAKSHESARVGEFWHTGFDAPLGPEVSFIVCSRRKRYMLVAPREDGQGVLARADDFRTWDRTGSWQVKLKGMKNPVTWTISDTDVEKSGLSAWGTYNPEDENSPPAATMFYDYLVILPDHLDMGPVVISLTRSQIRVAKKGLNDKIRLHQGAGRPMQALVFRAQAIDDRNADGDSFSNWKFTSNGFAPEGLYKRAMELSEAMREYKVGQEDTTGADEKGAKPSTEGSEF